MTNHPQDKKEFGQNSVTHCPSDGLELGVQLFIDNQVKVRLKY